MILGVLRLLEWIASRYLWSILHPRPKQAVSPKP